MVGVTTELSAPKVPSGVIWASAQSGEGDGDKTTTRANAPPIANQLAEHFQLQRLQL